jgi:hypothetical protein
MWTDTAIQHNIITANSAGNGGGVYCNKSPVTITNCSITGNTAVEGGGIYCYDSPVIISNCSITGNYASLEGGGGISCFETYFITIISNIISRNWSNDKGGGIKSYRSNLKVMNNTIVDNLSVVHGGGIYCGENSEVTVVNSIIWGNSWKSIYVESTSSLGIAYSDVQDSWQGGKGNMHAEPRFVDSDNGDYHLSDNSPCIGAGIMTLDVPETDIEGNPRPNPPDSNPDMGAYENPKAGPPGSMDGYVTDLLANPLTALIIAINTETKDQYKTMTYADGYYEILDLEPNTYWVICIKKGYKAGLKKAEVLAGEATRVDFLLTPKLE